MQLHERVARRCVSGGTHFLTVRTGVKGARPGADAGLCPVTQVPLGETFSLSEPQSHAY